MASVGDVTRVFCAGCGFDISPLSQQSAGQGSQPVAGKYKNRSELFRIKKGNSVDEATVVSVINKEK